MRSAVGRVGTGRAGVVVVLAAAAVVLPGSVLAHPAGKAPPHHWIATKIPQPGGIAVTLFELRTKLKPGASAPHGLAVTPVNRAKLPRGVAIVAVARLVKRSPPGTAIYVGFQAAFRSKTVRKISAADRRADTPEEGDALGAILRVFGTARVKGGDDPFFSGSFTWMGNQVSHSSFDKPDALVPKTKEEIEVADLLDKFSYNSGQAFSWSGSVPPTSNADAGTVADDLFKDLDPTILREIETALDVQFDNDFPEGSLTGDSGTTPGGTTTTTPAPTTYTCSGAQVTLFDNSNGDPVADGGAPPSFSTKGKAYCVTHVQTYHWNDGKGSPPGTLGLKRTSGTAGLPATVGPFAAKASSGQNGAPNVNWFVDPVPSQPTVIDGTYTCQDSNPATWSSNKSSGGAGFCIVYAVPAVAG